VHTLVRGQNRQRYIGFIINNLEKNPKKSVMFNEIRRKCKQMFNKDTKEMGIKIIRFNQSTGIVKCNRNEKENLILLLKSIKKLDQKSVDILPVATSGTIRSLINKHMSKKI